MLLGPILTVALAAALADAQAVVPDHQADIKRAVFDICPRIYTGAVSLTDPAQVLGIGYKATGPRITPGGKIPRAEMGEGATKIVVAGQAGADPSCSIWFGGPDSNKQVGYMLTAAGKAGFAISSPMQLGDGTLMLKASRKAGPYTSMAVIVGDAGGEFGSTPAATVILLK